MRCAEKTVFIGHLKKIDFETVVHNLIEFINGNVEVGGKKLFIHFIKVKFKEVSIGQRFKNETPHGVTLV